MHDSQEGVMELIVHTPLTKQQKDISDELEKELKDQKFSNFKGSYHILGHKGYDKARMQYATTSLYHKCHHLSSVSPGLILYAKGDDDVMAAIKYCRDKRIAMSIRTGGHQYCGFSSTTPQNMQLDLKTHEFSHYDYDEKTNRLICGPNHALGDWAERNHKNGIYLPMGVCWNVHLGGHVHTGGWGMVARSHGLLADHVKAFRIIIGTGEEVHVRKPDTPAHDELEAKNELHELNDDLYYAVLGGSIGGNFGVVKEFEFEPIRDRDHPNSACYMLFWLLTEERMRAVVKLMQEYNVKCANGEIPSDYEFMCTITGGGEMHMFPDPTEKEMIELMQADQWAFHRKLMPPIIQMWMCYTNKAGEDEQFDEQYFQEFEERVPKKPFWCNKKKNCPISYGLSKMFIMKAEREMEYPFIKRDRVSMELPTNFADVYTDRMHEIAAGLCGTEHGVHLVSQMQIYSGGAIQSNEATSHSSYSWRGQCLAISHDAFYRHNKFENALAWQQENDKAFVGPGGAFSERDMRVFAYTWNDGENNKTLEEEWQYYYDSREKYERLRRIKAKADPDSVFNSSPFSLEPLEDPATSTS